MTNYYNSGLYMESFFTKHKHLGLDYDYLLDEMLGCNYHLFLKHYSDDLDYKNDDDLNYSDAILYRQRNVSPLGNHICRCIDNNIYICATTLLDPIKYPLDDFTAAYHGRWGIDICQS